MRPINSLFKSSPYHNLNLIEITSSALLNNYNYFTQANPQAKIAPVLKSNAYGHGLPLIGKWIDKSINTPFICIDSLFEAYQLQKARVHTPILIIGYTFPENYRTRRSINHFTFPVFDEDTLASLNQNQPGASVHLKIDTGMNRLGINPASAADFAKLIKKYPRIRVSGIYSHLSQADNPHKIKFTQNQIQQFKFAIREFESRGVRFQWKHIAATAAAMPKYSNQSVVQKISKNKSSFITNPNHITDPEFNLIRLGLGFYGYSPFSNNHLISPALCLKSHLIQIKDVEAGSEIGYGGSHVAKNPMRIGILPIGYYDGLNRRLSNSGKVLVRVGESNTKRIASQNLNDSNTHNSPSNLKIENRHKTSIMCDIIGRVCMNITMIDLSHAGQAKVGDEVIIFSPNTKNTNTIATTASLCDTIPYEVLVNLASTTRRVILPS